MPTKKQTKDDTEVKKVSRTKKVQEDAVDSVVEQPATETMVVTVPTPPEIVPAAVTPSASQAMPTVNLNGTSDVFDSKKRQLPPVLSQHNRYSPHQNQNNNSQNNRQRMYQQQNRRNAENNNNPGVYMNNNDNANYTGDVINIKGLLEVLPDYGVIRQEDTIFDNPDMPKDVYISQSQIRRFSLRPGDSVTGFARPPKEGERYLSLLKVDKVDGMEPEEARKRPQFTKLTAIFPNKWLKLETTSDVLSTRLIDLVAPIGRGQRAMLVAPPKTGKTWLLKDIANGITTNYPEVALLVALIGERPEEVTHFSRSVKGEVFASNFDEKAEDQTRTAEICLERAKRMAERGKDVVILMDSLTRLARAYNMVAPPSGRTLTGGFDPAALYPAKHFFGAARNFEEGGSLTIIATALVDTGSRMDDVIFEEFKGTGNMELRLDRSLYERRIFPTIDVKSSGTRHEEYLRDKEELDKIFRLRRMVDLLDDREVTELVIDRLKKVKTNKEFLDNLHKGQ